METTPYTTHTQHDYPVRLRHALRIARECQWSPGLLKSVETEGRIIGDYSDPTPMIAFDERRLAVRDAVKHAERYLAGRSPYTMQHIVERLEAAIDRWGMRL